MSFCACGALASNGGSSCDRCQALKVLGLGFGAGDAEIKDAYRVLVKVWHPDRFPGDQRLRITVEEKLKEINAAYQSLTISAEAPRRSASGPEATRTSDESDAATAARPSGPKTPSGPDNAQPNHAGEPQPAPPQYHWKSNSQAVPLRTWEHHRRRRRSQRTIHTNAIRAAVVLGVLLVILTAVTLVRQSAPRHHPVEVSSFPTPRDAADQPPDASHEITREPHSEQGTSTQPPDVPSQNTVASGSKEIRPPADTPEPVAAMPPTPYFTVGSTKDEVRAVQGPPSSATENVFHYDMSKVHFKNDVVDSWDEAPLSPLKVRLLPAAGVRPEDYITVGSTRDQVLATQGTPTSFADDVFHYGASKIYFKDGVVRSWDVWPIAPLKVRLLPTPGTRIKTYFTVGSTKDEVLATQGTPTSFSDNVFSFDTSKVNFQNGVVQSWDEWPGSPLKARAPSK